MFIDLPSGLRQADFSRTFFQLEFREPFRVAAETMMRLRRELWQAGRQVLDERRFARLFDPALPVDPLVRRQIQRPGPPFVCQLPPGLPCHLDAGDRLELPVIFWGEGRQLLGDFASVLTVLGKNGFYLGEGRFDLAEIEALDASAHRQVLWRPGKSLGAVAPPALEAAWHLDVVMPARERWKLEFETPARLLSGGRPLFRPSFVDLFPFVLRRVTSILQAYCYFGAVVEPGTLIARAAAVEELENRLSWFDWRTLEHGGDNLDLGGVRGSILLSGEALGDLSWVLGLGTLMNLGKGASFGAGRYRLEAR